MKENKKAIHIDLLKPIGNQVELASAYDGDLMTIRCFATTEGTNFNGALFKREVLAKSYRTFIDKPVIIVPNRLNMPTGHGYSFATKKFDLKKRKHIGHITNAMQVIVDEDENIHYIDGYALEDIPQGEYRVVVDIVVYKQYYSEIASQLKFLHQIGELNFSMESLGDAIVLDNGVKEYESLLFTGLAIVDDPAFKNSKSIDVAEKMEEKVVDFEKLYNEEKAKYETLVAEKATLETNLATKETLVAELEESLTVANETLANTKVELANAQSDNETLKPYKEKVELAEREVLGTTRVETLAKFTDKEYKVEDVVELSQVEFSELLVEVAEKVKTDKDDTFVGMNTFEGKVKPKSKASQLFDILGQISE